MNEFSLEWLLQQAIKDLNELKEQGSPMGNNQGEYYYTTINEMRELEANIKYMIDLIAFKNKNKTSN